MLPITFATVVSNEEKTIEELMTQAKEYAQEIIVLDSSTDQTRKIAEKYADVIIDRPYTGTSDANGNKQEIITRAKHEWIVYLDGDEVLDDELLGIIKSGILFKNEVDGWWFRRKWFVDGRHFTYHGSDPQLKLLNDDWQLRLFRKTKVKWPDGIHNAPQIKNTQKYNSGCILHRVQAERFINRYEIYSKLALHHKRFNDMLVQAIREFGCIKKS